MNIQDLEQNELDWLAEYDKSYPIFEWFIFKYFPDSVQELLIFRNLNECGELISILNDIWFALPNKKFNIQLNPKGWSEFLSLIEN